MKFSNTQKPMKIDQKEKKSSNRKALKLNKLTSRTNKLHKNIVYVFYEKKNFFFSLFIQTFICFNANIFSLFVLEYMKEKYIPSFIIYK